MKILFKILFLSCAVFGSMTIQAQTQVVAHRGCWDYPHSAQNSIAALVLSGTNRVYGSEFDVSITKDGVVVVNHDPTIGGVNIEHANYADLRDKRLADEETVPTLEQYLIIGRLFPDMKMVLEIKPHESAANEKRCVDEVLRLIDKYDMLSHTEFISFSNNVCRLLVSAGKHVHVWPLDGSFTPEEAAKEGFYGIDYDKKVIDKHPDWISRAHKLGLKVNVWTLNSVDEGKNYAGMDADLITTDKPIESLENIK